MVESHITLDFQQGLEQRPDERGLCIKGRLHQGSGVFQWSQAPGLDTEMLQLREGQREQLFILHPVPYFYWTPPQDD